MAKARVLSAAAAAALAILGTGAADPYQGADDPYRASPSVYTVGGACHVDGGIGGLSFAQQGVTRSGAPYFKATTREVYLYYDLDCEGGSAKPIARWIFDNERPDLSKQSDLDNDLACNVIARIDSLDQSRPPATGTWTMYCDNIEEQHVLALRSDVLTTPMPATKHKHKNKQQKKHHNKHKKQTTPMPTTRAPGGRSVTWMGACALKSFAEVGDLWMDNIVFDEVGATADGRPFFKARIGDTYIYFDADCDGSHGSTQGARWVLDNGRPSTIATQDLDGDGKCDYHARLDSVSPRPPFSANWFMHCGAEGWVDVPVTLLDVDDKMVNSAGRGVLAAVVGAVAAAFALEAMLLGL